MCNQTKGQTELDFMKHKLLFLPFLIAIVGLSMLGQRDGVDAAAPVPAPNSSAPVVVELFTSQSCSSCPPADALLGELAKHDNVIALGCHVTYWDHLNWRDTLSRKFCTNRQRAYARHMGANQVYTPQMVVNGTGQFVGSNRAKASQAIASSTVQTIKLEISDTDTGTLTATLPALTGGPSLQTLWLMRTHSDHTQAIKSGENRGKTITYVNSVETLDQLGTWSGTAQTLSFPVPKGEAENPSYVLIAQPQGFGAITAAGRLSSTISVKQ